MKPTLPSLTLVLWMLSAALAAPFTHAATTAMYRTCQPFYYVEDANTFMNTLTQQQRDMEYEAPAADAAIHGCGKVPGFSNGASPSGVFGN